MLHLPLFWALNFNGDWLTALNLYSAKVLNELPAEGCHFLAAGVGLTKELNRTTPSFWKALTAVVDKFLIIVRGIRIKVLL